MMHRKYLQRHGRPDSRRAVVTSADDALSVELETRDHVVVVAAQHVRLLRELAPVALDVALPLEYGLPGPARWRGDRLLLGGREEVVAQHEPGQDGVLEALASPQLVVVAQRTPEATRLSRTTQVEGREVAENLHRDLQHTRISAT